MRKRILIVLPIILFVIALFIDIHSVDEKVVPKQNIPSVKTEEKVDILKLRNDYNNPDIIAFLEIPDVFQEIVVQTSDNNYYLHNDIYKNENIIGATFLDYRNNIDDSKKLLIYSHSDPEGTLPFVKLTNYNDEIFFKNHKYIYLTDLNKKRKYEVFSSYIETKDFDYVNLNSFNGLTYKQHLEKLKNKSYVKTDIEFDEDSKILILQTCSFENINTNTKYQLVIAKEV